MGKKNLTYFDGIYAIILILAIVLRVFFSSVWGLSEKEAEIVNSIPASSTTLYQVWTGALIQLFQASEFVARILPLLFGTALVVFPLFLRKSIGDGATILVGLGLALDPGLIAVSKQAGNEMLAIFALFTLFIFISQKRWAASGVVLAMGLLTGPYYWIGMIGFLICCAIGYVFFNKSAEEPNENSYFAVILSRLKKADWKAFLSGFGVMLLLGGTLFFTQPKVLAGIPNGIITFFSREDPGLNLLTFSNAMIGLIVTYLAILVFGFLGLKYLSAPWRSMFIVWSIVLFLMASLFPGRQLADYIWCILPLYLPAALKISRIKLRSNENRIWILSVTLILAVFALYFLYSLMQYFNNYAVVLEDSKINLYLLSALISFVIFVMILVILAWSWSLYISLDTVTLLGSGFLLFTFLVASMKSSGFDARPDQMMWFQTSYFKDADLFNNTIQRLDQDRTEKIHPLIVEIDGTASESLLWELRNYEVFIKQSVILGNDLQADVFITDINSMPQGVENLSGQDFIQTEYPAWSLMSFREWVKWAMYQETMYNNQQSIVWTLLFQGSLEVTADS
jgi:hypothetical protein